MRGKFLGETAIAGKIKDRWECVYCRENGASECRFNLNKNKRGKFHKCRFCKNMILLEIQDE